MGTTGNDQIIVCALVQQMFNANRWHKAMWRDSTSFCFFMITLVKLLVLNNPTLLLLCVAIFLAAIDELLFWVSAAH